MIGALVGMLLFNGSDSCLTAGVSLLQQLLPYVHQHVANVLEDVAAIANVDEEPDALDLNRVDRSKIERILFSMENASCMQEVAAKQRVHFPSWRSLVSRMMRTSSWKMLWKRTGFTASLQPRPRTRPAIFSACFCLPVVSGRRGGIRECLPGTRQD